MRCILHLVLALLVALLPVQSAAQSATDVVKKKQRKSSAAADDEAKEAERAQEETGHRRRRHKAQPKVIEVTPESGATPAAASAGTDAPKNEGQPAAAPGTAAVAASDEDETDFEDSPSKWLAVLSQKIPPRRYPYVLGVALGAVGLVCAYQAQGEAKRAQTGTSAAEAQSAVSNAQAASSLANVLYGLAGVAILTALVLEFLPEPVAEKASLTFHF
jgi:hypothetical protein